MLNSLTFQVFQTGHPVAITWNCKRDVSLRRKSWLKPAWNKHGYFNVTGSTVQKIGRAQADFFREVSSTNQFIFNHDFLHSGTPKIPAPQQNTECTDIIYMFTQLTRIHARSKVSYSLTTQPPQCLAHQSRKYLNHKSTSTQLIKIRRTGWTKDAAW